MKNKNKQKSPFRKKLTALGVILAIVLTISLRMYQGFQVDLLMKDLHQLEQQKKKLLSETNKLQAEVQRLKNVDRISRIAAQKFGLVINNDPVTILTIEDYEDLKKVKQDFAECKKEKIKINVAGVH